MNDLGIDEGIGFDEDARRLAGPVVGRLAVNQFEETGGEIKGGDEEFIKVRRFRHARENIKERGDLGGEHGTAGEQAEIGIKAGGAGMVVSRSEVEIGLEVAFLPSDNEQNLAVGF